MSGSFRINYDRLVDRYRGAGGNFEKFIQLACILCEREIARPAANRCPDCGGAVDAIYDLDRFDDAGAGSLNVLQRYFSLLPFRRRESAIWLGEGNTPCFEVPELASSLGVGRLFFKDESANPTRSTKDRIASVGLSRFSELGIRRLALSSTGNSSTAYARGVQLVGGFSLDIFVGRDFVERLNYPDHPAVTTHVVDGDFVDAAGAGQGYASKHDCFWEGGFFNLSRREGLKLAYLEAFDAMPVPPDHVFQAISSGMGLLGAFKGATEYRALGRLERVPAFVGVQQETCAPMAHAFGEGADAIADHHIVKEPKGVAYAILRGNPTASYPYIRDLCLQTGGCIEAATEAEIRTAHRLLEEVVGMQYCFASAVAFAGAIRLAERGGLSSDSVLLVNLTGANRPVYPVPSELRAMSSTTTLVS